MSRRALRPGWFPADGTGSPREFAAYALIDGFLVKRGLLEREQLAQVLSGRPTRVVGALAEIYDYLSIEVWLRSWNAARQRVAA